MMQRLLFLSLFVFVSSSVLVNAGDNSFKAKIGILRKSGEKVEKLKAKDLAKSGEQVRVVVQPQQAGVVYVVYVEEKEVTLLNPQKAKKVIEKNKILILPSNYEYFQFDNSSHQVSFVIICNATPIPELEELFKAKDKTTTAKWVAVETKLSAGSKMKLNEKSEKPFTMAGNVRSVNDDFVSKLPVFEANGRLIRKYEIEIKK
jgi:hypothetical protein